MDTIKLLTTILLLSVGLLKPTYAEIIDSSNVFTLEQALILAEKNNRDILKSIAEVKSAKADNQQAMASFLPALELSSTYSSTNDALYSFMYKLQQQVVTQNDFATALLNDPGTNNQFTTQVSVQQPIINIDAWMGKSAANSALRATELKGEYTKKHVLYAVKQTYYGLQLAKNRLEVIEKAHKAASSYLKMAEDNLAQGYLKDADVLSVKVRMLELAAQKAEAQNQIKSVSEMLNFLMARDLYAPIEVADKIQKVVHKASGIKTVENRADVMAMKYGMEAREKMKNSNLMKFVPRINGFGNYNMYDENIGGFEANSWMLGINMQWKLFNGGKNLGSYNKSKAQYLLAETSYYEYLDKGNMELSNAIRNIHVNESNLLTYETAALQAQESLRIRTNRYKEGMERTSDLLAAEAKYAESALKHLNAIYQYNISVFKYELLSSDSNL
ncbi:TolC family protein [Plebeiibacterium marinum]|uniref:TolC family protein n=1 Tax=Plebeiibacterium marinum TaxID=2992111 RepID=A0AAE3SJP1_9BACT|nr:TolC family protein [Plebeiobacterium marinum]MCW3805940.1 TolC family protein [Plebeiobacterium marinum]